MSNQRTELKIIKQTAENADTAYLLFGIESRCFPSPWSRAAFTDALRNPSVDILTAELDGTLVGFCITMRVLDEAELLNIAVDPSFRRRGIARALLGAASERLTGAGAATVFLEVRQSNASAQALYDRLGFEHIGIRRRYYSAPTEDAILMKASLPLSER